MSNRATTLLSLAALAVAGAVCATSGVAQSPTRPTEAAVVVECKHTFHDKEMRGIASHAMWIPEGLKVDAGVRWLKRSDDFVHFKGRVAGPGDVSVHFDISRSFKFFDATTLKNEKYVVGQVLLDGSEILNPPKKVGDAALHILVPRLWPGARNVRLIDVRRLPQAERLLRASVSPMLKVARQGSETTGFTTEFRTEVIWVHVRYEEGERQWEEQLSYTVFVYETKMNGAWAVAAGMWRVGEVRTCRAPFGKLAPRATKLWQVVSTLRPTATWDIRLERLRQRMRYLRTRNQAVVRSRDYHTRNQLPIDRKITEKELRAWNKRRWVAEGIEAATLREILALQASGL